MGDLIQIRDYQKKPKIETPLQEGLSIIARAMAETGAGIDGLAWPGMDVQAPYMSPEKEPSLIRLNVNSAGLARWLSGQSAPSGIPQIGVPQILILSGMQIIEWPIDPDAFRHRP